MANPQPDQFTKISNELLEAMCRVRLSGHEWSIVHTVIRKTYGYNKKADWISGSQLNEMTGLIKQRINEAKKRLVAKKIIIQKGRLLSLNKDYDQWVESNGKALLGNGKALLKVTEKRPHKRKKETITKEIGETSSPELKTNNLKDMSWNNKSDDFEEGVVDLDGDGSLKEEKKTPTRKYPNAPTVCKLFLEVQGRFPANWKVNKTQLQACENLYTERGLKSIKKALVFYEENKGEKFCPKITSPYDLDSKWTKLGEYKLSL